MVQKKSGISRRELALGAALPLALNAQTPEKPADELEAARAQAKQMTAQLRKVSLPQLLEPSFVFHP